MPGNCWPKAKLSQSITLAIDPKQGGRESFKLDAAKSGITITGGGPAGVLYGVQELLTQDPKALAGRVHLQQTPDFEIRGVAYYLMKEGSYHWKLSPQEFPHFFDRAMLAKYLDYLYANRFNTIFIWTGHLFPSIMEMPEYPEATDLTREELLRNQEQFRWFTRECARRNISVLLLFYNILISPELAKAHHIPDTYAEPTPFVEKYMRYALERFLKTFDSVGLYVCPGEALSGAYQPKWIKDVILGAAKVLGSR